MPASLARSPAHSAAVASAIGKFLQQWISTLAGAIDDAEAVGELVSDIPSADLAEFIVNAREGGAVKSMTTSSVDSVRICERVVARLVR